jgi:exopolysaccharide biosynthesis polyprenyl glycosylphosphotransferase
VAAADSAAAGGDGAAGPVGTTTQDVSLARGTAAPTVTTIVTTTGTSTPATADPTSTSATAGPTTATPAAARPATATTGGWERRYVFGLVAVDAVVGLVAALAASLIRFSEAPTTMGDPRYALLTVLLPAVWVVAMAVHRGYDTRVLFSGNEEYQRVLRAGLSLTAAVAVGSYALQAEIARGYVLVAIPAAVILGVGARYLQRHRLSRAWAAGRCLRRVLVVGHERSVAALTRQMRHERYHGMDVVAACVPGPGAGGAGIAAVPIHGTFDDVASVVQATRVDAVVVLACPELDGPALRRLAWRLERLDIDLIVASALLDVGGERTTLRPVDGLPMLHVEHPRLTGARRVVKQVVDRVGAALLLAVLSPLLLLTSAMVRWDRRAPGPAFFRQTRVGQGGAEFHIWKFRTMHTDAERRLGRLRHLNQHDGVLFKLRDDPRVTPVGRWLRRFSLDELPQLLNVLSGEMSLVGPRPPLPDEVARYPADMRRRLVVKPGLTGLWQVSGRSDLSWEESMRLDLRYVENWSLSLDLVIMLRTLHAVLKRTGAY